MNLKQLNNNHEEEEEVSSQHDGQKLLALEGTIMVERKIVF